MLMHRQDSIMHRQDSIKAHKDSVIAASQRILETYAVPDTMLYKRIFTWTHDQYFNNIEIQPIDTSYNNYFTEYPFHREDVGGTYLGVIGSATQYYNYFKRKDEGNAIFYTPYRMYSYSPSDLLQYNTKTPFTELAYWGTLLSTRTKEEDDFKVMTTQNILPELNMRLEFRRWGGKGILLNEETANRTAVVAFNYMGKRYLSHFGYITNRVVRTENGGAVDQDESVGPGFNWIRDTTVDAREIAVRLGKANAIVTGGSSGIGLVVFHVKLEADTVQTAVGIDLLNGQLSAFLHGNTVGSGVTGQRTCTTDKVCVFLVAAAGNEASDRHQHNECKGCEFHKGFHVRFSFCYSFYE